MPFSQATGDACGCCALSGRDDDAHAIVAAASHGATTGIHHEADQEPARTKRTKLGEEKKKKHRQLDRSHTTDTSEEDDSHAVITVHPNKVRKRDKITQIKTKRQNNRKKML